MSLKIETNKLKIDFQNHINVIIDFSGSGKTYLFRRIMSYLCGTELNTMNISSDDNKKSVIALLSSLPDENTVVLYDDADLTLDMEIFKLLDECKATIIMSIKRYDYLVHYGDIGIYKIKYNNDGLIKSRRVR